MKEKNQKIKKNKQLKKILKKHLKKTSKKNHLQNIFKKSKKKSKKMSQKNLKIEKKILNALSHHCTVAWVTRPPYPKGVKDVIKQAQSRPQPRSRGPEAPRLPFLGPRGPLGLPSLVHPPARKIWISCIAL